MTLNPPIERIRVALVEAAAIEARLRGCAEVLLPRTTNCPTAHALIEELLALADAHLAALTERLQEDLPPPDFQPSDHEPTSDPAGLHRASLALRSAYALVQEAAAHYSWLEPIGHRARDSWVIADAGTTSHIARQHTQEYLGLGGRMIAVMHDLVIEELDADGFPCGCACPACSVGICMCAVGTREIWHEASTAAGPPLAEHGVPVLPPRDGSAAAQAGLRAGDHVVAVDGEPIELISDLQRAIRDHQPGDRMELTVRRPAGETSVFVEHRREGSDANEDECVVPVGQNFRLDQAREAQQQLRAREGDGTGAGGLSRLSPRETQVLRMVAAGETNPAISESLEISRHTVDRHVANILHKLGVTNRAQAAGLAARHGLVPRD